MFRLGFHGNGGTRTVYEDNLLACIVKRFNHFPLNGRQFDVRAVSSLEAGQVNAHLFSFQLRGYAACKNHDIGIFHFGYRALYVALFLEADVEVELGIAGKVLEADFNVIRFAGLYTHAVCLRTAAVFVGEVLHLFAVDEQLYGTVAVEVEHNIAAFPGSEYALVNGREIGEVYARCKNSGSGSTEMEWSA